VKSAYHSGSAVTSSIWLGQNHIKQYTKCPGYNDK
jgi:hypothetical protein